VKSRRLMSVIALSFIGALAIPFKVAAQEQRYKVIDLGTFGGPASYLDGDNGVNGAPNEVLNSRGVVAGWADISTPDPNAPDFCFNSDCFISHAFRWDKGVLTDLGVLPGGGSSQARHISGSGLIIGQSQHGVIDPLVAGLPEFRAVLWREGRIIDLGTLGGNDSAAFAVNNRSQVVGAALNDIPDPFSFLATQIRAFLWQNGAMHDLGTLGGPKPGLFSSTSAARLPDSRLPLLVRIPPRITQLKIHFFGRTAEC
jgi:probable HAF family extracellular repeat protein